MVVFVSGAFSQETSVRARIKSAAQRMIERGVFIDLVSGSSQFSVQMVVVSTPVSHETVPKSNEGRQVDANYFKHFANFAPQMS